MRWKGHAEPQIHSKPFWGRSVFGASPH